MNAIGGYLPLESNPQGTFPHQEGALLNSGRNALEYILRAIGSVARLHIPYYTCSAILEPLHRLGIPYTFYTLNPHLELATPLNLPEGEYLLYTNYFGVKDHYASLLAAQYGDHLIVDNAQAFYAAPLPGTHTLYSPRKFVGLPDGGIALTHNQIEVPERDTSHDRCTHLLKRLDLGAQAAYADFRQADDLLDNRPLRRMSHLTHTLLRSADHPRITETRRRNFLHLHQALSATNLLPLPPASTFACPMAYPYLSDDPTLRQRLIADQVFVPTYWPNVPQWCPADTLEHRLSQQLLALPLDQRYGFDEMDKILRKIL